MNNKIFDCAIIGAGLAGLTLAIGLVEQGRSVLLLEKECFPFHRVCGEYVSMESWAFLQRLGLPLDLMNLPVIDELKVSSPNGNSMVRKLDLGGFGISRHKLDADLAELAKRKGVVLMEGSRADQVSYKQDMFNVSVGDLNYSARVVCGSFGKKSLLDRKLGRNEDIIGKGNKNDFLAIKYHVKIPLPSNRIELHNFHGGYCGISKIEEDRYCLCYLTETANLKENGNDIETMEEKVLSKNPFLRDYFSKAKFLFSKPLAISQISFGPKSTVENHILMIGDSAGTITPLCGNGMSMAMRASFLAGGLINRFLEGEIDRGNLEQLYSEQWKTHFLKRMQAGRRIQYFFGRNVLTNASLALLKRTPALADKLIASTHGETF
jgi:flavin-dependent dehydrogenase